MVPRKAVRTITMKEDPEGAVEEQPDQRKPAESGQFRLQVDRQTKRSFATFEAAEQAGMAIKKSYPLLQVAVYDLKESVNKIIETPSA
jgi:hypothetical protein